LSRTGWYCTRRFSSSHRSRRQAPIKPNDTGRLYRRKIELKSDSKITRQPLIGCLRKNPQPHPFEFKRKLHDDSPK
jgi:hypothetical protein